MTVHTDVLGVGQWHPGQMQRSQLLHPRTYHKNQHVWLEVQQLKCTIRKIITLTNKPLFLQKSEVTYKVSEGIRRYQKVSEVIKRYQKVSEGIRRYQKVSEGIRRYQRVSEGIRIYQKISESIRRYQKISKGIRSY